MCMKKGHGYIHSNNTDVTKVVGREREPSLFLILIPKMDAVEIGFRPLGNGACLGAREAEFFVGTTRVWPDFFEPR